MWCHTLLLSRWENQRRDRGLGIEERKRDSQMVMMYFLNKVHFNSPMDPLELEIYHQINDTT
ncbi:hypothetical protein BS17DRAFT_855167 [Gyrodon lividus]|nr:hypothetical protein BS17DRAFT_855167 [Gyrodon lividus]